ncbi:MAG: hypothetical protein K1X89_17090 [Myxococcaceae bacterium]|nr:hypothetical protein [Myxococcaceae bacterium]
MNALLVSLVAGAGLLPTQDFIEGAEIGTADQFVAFESRGKYHAERADKKAGTTIVRGSWALDGDKISVKPATCKGPACKELNVGYAVDVTVVAERAMTIKAGSAAALLASGSYYCRYQGCEKRSGVELVSRGAKAGTMNYLLDFLIDKNRKRDVTVVWWGKKLQDDPGKTRIEYCTREEERGKKTAELVAGDLKELAWIGELAPAASAEKDCLWDVRVTIGDDTALPPKVRSGG